MAINEEKMKIVIENYFRDECNINTTIHDAFEKGFRIGVKKAIPKQKTGKWIRCTSVADNKSHEWCGSYCSECGEKIERLTIYNYCPGCGAKMEG